MLNAVITGPVISDSDCVMAANLDECDHLSKRLREITEVLRDRDLASTGAEERICELRREAECTAERMSELLTLWIAEGGSDSPQQ
jgi:hypothetical protein